MRMLPPVAAAIVITVTGVSCDRHAAAPPHVRGEPDAVYRVRGKVEQVPDPSKPMSEFIVRHEPIDDFRNPDGSLGMDTMSMPFPLATSASLDGIGAGDAVEIEFAVWSKPGTRGYEARRVVKLPDGTVLRFGPARREASAAAEGPRKR